MRSFLRPCEEVDLCKICSIEKYIDDSSVRSSQCVMQGKAARCYRLVYIKSDVLYCQCIQIAHRHKYKRIANPGTITYVHKDIAILASLTDHTRKCCRMVESLSPIGVLYVSPDTFFPQLTEIFVI